MPGLELPDSAKGAALVGEDAARALEEAARLHGVLCSSCALGMEGPGFEFLSLRTELIQGQPTVVKSIAFICDRDTCIEARQKLSESATATRPAGGWTLFIGQEPAPPPSNGNGESEPPPGS